MTIILSEDIGHRIRILRNMEALTLKDVADRTGMSQSAVSTIESGKSEPTTKSISRILRAINPNYELGLAIIDKNDYIFKNIKG